MTKKIVVSFLFLLFALPAMAQQGPPSITVGWGAVSVPTPGALTYKVQRATAQAGPFTQLGNAISAVSFTDTTVVRGSTYFYRIFSSCPATGAGCGTAATPLNGDSGPSNIVSGTVPATSQTPPTPTLTITDIQ
jgi:cellulose 1,4-beta-cellobiosidase